MSRSRQRPYYPRFYVVREGGWWGSSVDRMKAQAMVKRARRAGWPTRIIKARSRADAVEQSEPIWQMLREQRQAETRA